MAGAPRELAAYHDEPAQLPSGSFGKCAYLRLGFEAQSDRSVLRTLHRRAPLLVQQALYWDEQMPGLPCVYMISNSGGILQGDRYRIEIELPAGTQAHVTTQAATKIHSMDANYATQTQQLTLGPDAYLEYMPQPLIPHASSRFVQHTCVSIDQSATLVYAEVLMAGRKYYGAGELFRYDLFSSTLHAHRPDGESLFTEKFVIEPRRRSVTRLGAMGPFHVFGSFVVLTPKQHAERLFEAFEPSFDPTSSLVFGASHLPRDAGLVVKVLGMETAPVNAAIRRFWSLAREEVAGARVPENFLWA